MINVYHRMTAFYKINFIVKNQLDIFQLSLVFFMVFWLDCVLTVECMLRLRMHSMNIKSILYHYRMK